MNEPDDGAHETVAEDDALRSGVAAVWLDRDLYRVSGPDAIGFLQGQLSQDVTALAVGSSAWSFVLQPQGKVDALVRVTRVDDDAVVIDVDGGYGESLLVRLKRFKLRTKAELDPLDWRVLGLRGPQAVAVAADLDGGGKAVLTVEASWPGLAGVDLLGAEIVVPEGIPLVGSDDYEAARIEAGVPRMGAELTERTIPAESGLIGRTVSFTKGCYTGQELVARIDSRGNHVPRYLRGLRLDDVVPAGSRLTLEGKDVGWLTSVATSPTLGPVALGYVGRDVEPPAEVVAVTEDGRRVPARVALLPLVG
jgi:folate-binding protein YgfZ